MVSAFRTWTSYTAARAEWRSFVSEKNDILLRKKASTALTIWRNRRKVSNFGRKIFLGWQQREMVSAFRTWTLYIQSKSEWSTFCATKEDQLFTTRIRKSLRYWCERVQENKSMRVIVRNMSNSKAGACLRRWKECVDLRRLNRERLKQAFRYLTNSLLAKSFRSWSSFAIRSKSLKSQSASVKEMVIAHRKRNIVTLWMDLVTEKMNARKGDARFRSHATRLCLAKWLLWRRERAKSRRAIDDSRNVIARAKLRSIFMTWSFYAMKNTLLRAQVEHMVRTRGKTEQIAALRIWRDCARTRRVNKIVIGEALERMSTLRLRALTNHWLAISRASQTMRAERLDVFRIKVEKKRKTAVFDHMRLHYVLFRAKKMAIATILSRRLFRVWFREAVLAAKRLRSLETILDLELQIRMRRGLDAFRACVAAEKERRQNNSRLQLAALVIHLGAARRSIAAWRHETTLARLTRSSYSNNGPVVRKVAPSSSSSSSSTTGFVSSRSNSQRSSVDYGGSSKRRTTSASMMMPAVKEANDDGLDWLRAVN